MCPPKSFCKNVNLKTISVGDSMEQTTNEKRRGKQILKIAARQALATFSQRPKRPLPGGGNIIMCVFASEEGAWHGKQVAGEPNA